MSKTPHEPFRSGWPSTAVRCMRSQATAWKAVQASFILLELPRLCRLPPSLRDIHAHFKAILRLQGLVLTLL